MTLILPAEFPLSIGICFLIAITQFLSSFIPVSRRVKLFKESGVLKDFETEHKEAFGADAEVDALGNPDAGCGRYSDKLSYKEWYEMNCA